MNELLKGVYTKYKSYIKIPNIYQSTEKVCSLPKIISGAIYSGFPIKLVPKSPSNNNILLFEKSTNLICPFSSIKIFSFFIFLYIILFSCNFNIAITNSDIINFIFFSSNFPPSFSTYEYKSPPL